MVDTRCSSCLYTWQRRDANELACSCRGDLISHSFVSLLLIESVLLHVLKSKEILREQSSVFEDGELKRLTQEPSVSTGSLSLSHVGVLMAKNSSSLLSAGVM